MRRWLKQTIVAAFLVLITLPLAANLAGVDGADPAAENRELAAFPRLTVARPALAGWRSGLERRAGLVQATLVDAAAAGALLAVFGIAVLHVAARSYNPFIYFRF